MFAGFITMVLWDTFVLDIYFIMTEALPAMLVSFIVIIVVSKLTEQPKIEQVRKELAQAKRVWKK